ncbi:hypothetical protein F4212_12900 [Candidatus Poribacteria bacterium]|nr:hypothetical protein [Candidatus Poribacteria bacterium]
MIHKTLRNLFRRQRNQSNTRALGGGRISMQHPYRQHSIAYLAPPDRSQSVWQLKNWTEEELLNLPVDRLMKIIIDISPEVNKAYTDFLRNCNEGWYYEVDPIAATPIIDNFIARLETKHHDFDVLLDQIYAGIYLRGAIFIELVLDQTADMATKLAVLDPITARFNRITHPIEGEQWELGQWQNGKWVSLENDPTVMYVPFNNAPDMPFGKSFMATTPLDVIRQLGVMNDFRSVLQSQGWARADFSVDSDKIKAFMPAEIKDDTEAEDQFIRDFIDGINGMYSHLKPNEGFAHLDIVSVNMPKGGQMQASFFGLIDGLMRLYDRRISRATGSTPLKQHSNEHVTETHAREQRKDYRVNIVSVQSTVAGTLSTLFGYVLRAEGVQGQVTFHFDTTLDPVDIKELAEADGTKIDNLKKLKDLRDSDGIDDATYQKAVNQYKIMG